MLGAFSNYYEKFAFFLLLQFWSLTFFVISKAIVIRTDKSDDSSDLHLTSNNKPVIGRNRGNRTSKFSSKFLTPVTTTPASMNDDDDIDILVNGAARSLDNDFQRIRNAPPMSTTAENGKKRANTTLKAKETLIRYDVLIFAKQISF